jgi:hypothetical protein
MSVLRKAYTATLLSDGRVLIAGGWDCTDAGGTCNELASAELYDPATGEFGATGSMVRPRSGHTATLLPDGRVLMAGGESGNTLFSSAELYDPKTGTFTLTGSMTNNPAGQTATLLPDGRVLMAGGESGPVEDFTTVATAEMYDPKTGRFGPTGSMTTPRVQATATLLNDGRVLVVGGDQDRQSDGRYTHLSLAGAELYDPATGKFSQTGSMFNVTQGHTATLLADGRVLIDGGVNVAGGIVLPVLSVELYDPVSGKFIYGGERKAARYDATATLLADGRVLIAGGRGDQETVLSSAEFYDPTTSEFTPAPSLTAPRYGATSILLPDGGVLIAGGWDGTTPLASAELYTP